MKKESSTPQTQDKEKALQLALDAVHKTFGKEALQFAKGNLKRADTLSSGSVALDRALGGGYARGKIIEAYGPSMSGKSTLALHAIAEAQKLGEIAAYIDAENALDANYAEALGVDLGQLLISQPESGEQALQITETLVKSGSLSFIVVDSVAALVPQKELDGEIGDATMGGQARLMSQAMRHLTGITAKSNSILFFINQIRMKVGGYGNPETTAGGEALKFYATQRLDVRRKGTIKDGEEAIANEVEVKVVKNRIAPPLKVAEMVIVFGKGIDKGVDLVKTATSSGILTKSGAWYSYGEQRLACGEANTGELLVANPELFAEIRKKVMG